MPRKSRTEKLLVISNMYPDVKHPSYGIFVRRFCDQLDSMNLEYDLSAMQKPESEIGKIFGYIQFYIRTFFMCLRSNYFAVYVHYASHSSPGVLWARHFRKFRLAVNVHGSDVFPQNSRQERMQKYAVKALQRADLVIVPSEYFKKYVCSKYNILPQMVRIYPSAGVDPEIFHPCKSGGEQDAIQKEFNLDRGKTYIGCVGRMTEGKGQLTFAKALVPVLKRYPEIGVILVGSGPCEREVLKILRDADIEKQVKKLPMLDQDSLAKIYRILSLLVFPTEREAESLGLVALEAMASGTIVLASDYAAPKYYICDGKNGLKFAMGDVSALDKKICEFIEMTDEEKEDMAKLSLQTAQKYSASEAKIKLREIMDVLRDQTQYG